MSKHNVVDYDLDSFGWKTYLQQRRGTSKLTLNKIIVVGSGLKKGQVLYCYIGKAEQGRKVMITYLDGKPRQVEKEGGGVGES
jgi:hypothetical protein